MAANSAALQPRTRREPCPHTMGRGSHIFSGCSGLGEARVSVQVVGCGGDCGLEVVSWSGVWPPGPGDVAGVAVPCGCGRGCRALGLWPGLPCLPAVAGVAVPYGCGRGCRAFRMWPVLPCPGVRIFALGLVLLGAGLATRPRARISTPGHSRTTVGEFLRRAPARSPVGAPGWTPEGVV